MKIRIAGRDFDTEASRPLAARGERQGADGPRELEVLYQTPLGDLFLYIERVENWERVQAIVPLRGI